MGHEFRNDISMEQVDREISEYLERDFSSENLGAYADACRKTAWKIVEMISDRGGEPVTVLLPSRGAVPFIIGAIKAIKEDPGINSFVKEAFGTDNLVELPPLACFDTFREQKAQGQKPLVRILILPFTADASFPDKKNREIVDGMRQFMTRVAVEMLFKPPNKRTGKEFRLYLDFLKEVEGRKGLADFYERFQPVKRGEPVLFIDTVVSGRASHTILSEFERLGVDLGYEPFNQMVPLLIVDDNGRRLKDIFRKYVDVYTHTDTESVIKMPKIISEDRGAALLGVCAVIYENLIVNAIENRVCGDVAPCFGTWHDVPRSESGVYSSLFNKFINLVGMKISGRVEGFEQERTNFLRELKSYDVLTPNANMTLSEVEEFFKVGMPFKSARETGSHIVQIRFTDEGAHKTVEKICRNV
ncbi:hypothetical protein HYT59_00030 [Candidatus Woesebacteria bacterium]|nr:hypothetical protein [Candidatus Woesebacteria bacterium]